MVPVVELPQHKSTRSVPAASEAMEYPSWTRDEESENEAHHAWLRRDTHRSRSRSSKRRDSPLVARENGESAHAKRGKDSSDSGEESGHESAGKKNDKTKTDKSPPYGLPPQAVAAPPAVTQRPPSSRPPPKLPKIKTDLEPAAAVSPTPDTKNGDLPGPVNNADNPPPQGIPPESPHSPKTPKPGPPPASVTQPVRVPAPVITAPPGPALSSGARKGLEPPPTEVPKVTLTESNASRMSALRGQVETARPEPVRDDYHKIEGNLHSSTENALIAVGSVGATIITFFIFWLAWRCFKMHKRKQGGDPPGRGPTLVPSLDKPKQLIVGLASRIPVLRERVAKRSWANIDKPYDEAYWEKTFPVSSESPQGGGKGIHVHTAITTRSDPEGQSDLSLPRQTPQQPMASQQAPFKTGTRSRHQLSGISDISSLSSGFGDGDIIMPPAHGTGHSTATIITAEPLAVPAPVEQRNSVSESSQRRETVYTEASEDPLPRFRTINSWVRQQSGRIKRANQRDMAASDAPPVPSMPPEQDFRLMMPDEEEPRRVEEATAEAGHADYRRAS
ncbi:hypothetical protein HRG_009154 [Hirsutella rhossiliensis]|uniref:Uncharacterized protein n=1 Tax=Hirsutella rhossiliensis TaxID=111463 RepID=A0A9P8MPY4_9HYPO|nr:uncharacterized protein HRG_09154 [Hirsutella rhossiliensis]KAH0960133.1 hypothetical protein HRG_09154 [Hirsutella rhossiliensis]